MKYINNMTFAFVLWVIAVKLLLLQISSLPFTSMTMTLSSYEIEASASYKFKIDIEGDMTDNFVIPQGSQIIITFPSAYPSTAPTNNNCSILSWPAAATGIVCSYGYNILTISNGFNAAINMLATDIISFEFVVYSITNPSYSQIIPSSSIIGKLRSNFVQILTIDAATTITIESGSLVVGLSCSPNTTSSTSILTITIKPTHSIPDTGCIKITFDKSYTNAASTTTLNTQLPNCLPLSNVSNNIYCATEAANVVFVTNLFTSKSSMPFSFTLSPFNNPPTTQPFGSIIFETFNDRSKLLKIDSSSNNKISGIIANPIQNPQINFLNTLIGSVTQTNISMAIANGIIASDTIFVTTPSEISCSSVVSVVMGGFSGTSVSVINSTTFSFKNIIVSSSMPIVLTINSLTLPSYAATISSPFLIYVMRSNYEVCKMNQSFPISLTPSKISGSLSTNIYEAGVSSNYILAITLQQSITSTSIIELYFNPIQFSISQPITCLSSASTTCQILSVANNTIKIQSATISSTKSLSLTLSGLKNPSSVGNFTPIFITTYIKVNNQYFILGANNDFAFFSVEPRSMNYDNLKLSSTQYKVYALASYTFTIKNNNYLPSNSKIRIIFPSQINIQSITCPKVCIPIITGSPDYVEFQQLGPFSAGTSTDFIVNNVINPISTKPTSSFRLQIYDSSGILLQYLQAGINFQALTPSSLSVTYSAEKLQNGFTGWMNITLTPLYAISQIVSILIILPKEFKCSSCATSLLNSLENQIVFSNIAMSNGKYELNINGFTLFHSFQSKTLKIGVLSNNLAFNFANGSMTITNTIASALSFSYSFTSYQLLGTTNLQLSNFSSQASFQYTSYMQIIFGADFDISGALCINNDLTCSISSSKIVVVLINQGNITSISIKNIVNPGTSPSTTIAVSSYSITGFLIDRNFDMAWRIICSIPCKTCPPYNISECWSCYSNEVLVQSRVLYRASTKSCVSDCGDTFYRNYSTNICLSCSSSCLNCYNFSFCTSCAQSKYLLSSTFTCYSECPTGYFQKSSNCLACTTDLNCYTCNNELTCTSCFGFFYYQSQCLPQCPILVTITNNVNYTCDLCPTNCSSCQLRNNSVYCLSCSSGLMDNGACVQSCITYGTVPTNSMCSVCDSTCLTCQGTTTFCLTCPNTSEYRYFLSNKCYQICPDKYYNNENTLTCATCTYPCQTCYNFSSNGCKTCLFNFSLFGTICSSACPSTYYSTGIKCQLCVSPCLTCSSEMLCFTCRSNFTFLASNYSCLTNCPTGYVSVNQSCTVCSSNCLTCLTVTFCSSCHNGSYILNGNCYNPCPSTYFGNQLTMKCESCHFSCSVCTSFTFCSVCRSGYYMQANNTCISLCLSNQIPINGNCQNCNSKCSVCQVSVDNCTACNSGYIYAPTLNMCYLQCPSPLFYSILNKMCISSCSGTFYSTINSTTNQSNCQSCPSLCTSCISNTQCGGCISGSYSYASQCYLSCPPTAPYAFSFVCQTCNVLDCLTCAGTSCQSCKSGKLLIQGKSCITSCSNLQVYNSINKTCDTIYQSESNSSNSNNQTIITNPASSIDTAINLQFIPFPYFILFIIASIIILMLHFKAKLAAIPTLYGIVGPFLSFSILTTLIIIYIKNQQAGTTLQMATYLLWATLALIFCLGILTVRFRYQIEQCEKPIINIISIIHYSSMSLLTANIGQYNSYFIQEHKKYWKKYKTISKVGMILALPIFTSGGVLSFSITDKSNFLFYAGIQICLLGFLNLMISLAWLWIPLQPPPENQSITSNSSEQSTEQLSDNHQSDSIVPNSSQNNSLSKMDSMGKLRSSEQKQDSLVRGSINDHSDQQKQLSEIAQQPFQQADIQRRLRNSHVKSEIQNAELAERSSLKAKSTYETNQIKGVVKVSKSDIQKAIEKGLFRKDETEILKAIKQQQEFSRIADAQKLNDYMKKQQKQMNIFEQYHQQQELKSPKMQKRDEEKKPILQILQVNQQKQPNKQLISNEPKPQTILSSSIKKQSIIQYPKNDSQMIRNQLKEVDPSIANSMKRQSEIFSSVMNEQTIIIPQNKQGIIVNNNGYDFKADSDINFVIKKNRPAILPSRTSTQRGSLIDQILFQQNPKLSQNSNLEKDLDVFGNIEDIEDIDNVTSKEELQFNNIIFQDSDQEKKTYYQGASSIAENHQEKNVFDVSVNSSLGTIQNKKIIPVKIQNKIAKQQRIASPSFDSKERRTFIMQDFDEEQQGKQINIFRSQQSRIKPKFSKQLSKVQAPQQIIHADFQEIISIDDGDSLKFIQEGHQYIESGRKLTDRINEDIHDHDNDSYGFRPSSMLRQASIHYQPVKQQNNAPKDPSKQIPRYGSRLSRKQ